MTKEELDYIIEKLVISHNNHRVRIEYRNSDVLKFYAASVGASITILAFGGVIKRIAKSFKNDLEEGE